MYLRAEILRCFFYSSPAAVKQLKGQLSLRAMQARLPIVARSISKEFLLISFPTQACANFIGYNCPLS